MIAEVKVVIKPLSVNRVWQGRRFKTKDYKEYEEILLAKLPDIEIPIGRLVAEYEFGLSNVLSDWDNPVKPLQDILQKRYNFNDLRIDEAHVYKKKVNKGEEYIKFKLRSIDEYRATNKDRLVKVIRRFLRGIQGRRA